MYRRCQSTLTSGVVGPMARSASDLSVALDVVAGPDDQANAIASTQRRRSLLIHVCRIRSTNDGQNACLVTSIGDCEIEDLTEEEIRERHRSLGERSSTLIKVDPGVLKNNGPSKCAGWSTARSLVG